VTLQEIERQNNQIFTEVEPFFPGSINFKTKFAAGYVEYKQG
jgi:hypothetical protein